MAPEVDKRVWSKVQNVVVSANIFAKLPLEKLAVILDNSDYTPETFPGLIYKVKDDELSFKKASFLLFSSGRIICAGTKSVKAAKDAVKHVVEDLKNVGIEITKKPKKNKKSENCGKKAGQMLTMLVKHPLSHPQLGKSYVTLNIRT